MKPLTLSCLLVASVSLFHSCRRSNTVDPSTEMPNIVLILADDMGYGDVQALNPGSGIPTPNLDRLAVEGMSFTDAHTPSAVCTPTRYGLLMGRYCWRTRLKRGVLNGYSKPLIDDGRMTFAAMLKEQGYQTGIVGKWHLGLDFVTGEDQRDIDFTRALRHGPMQLGFDYSYIIPASLDFPPYVYLHNGQPTSSIMIAEQASSFPEFWRKGPRADDFIMEETLDHLLEKAVGFLDRSSASSEPFLLYFPLTAPHKPTLPHERFRGRTALGPYGDFIMQVDWTVGQVMSAIDRNGIAGNTLLIYTSDNGSYMFSLDGQQPADHVNDRSVQGYYPKHHRANHIFRGTKADIWEAGHRVPFLLRWPGVVSPGSRSGMTICLTDVFATLAELTGSELPDTVAEDSYSFLSLLKGDQDQYSRPAVIHHSVRGTFAVRQDNWKLVLGNGSGGRERPRGEPFERPYMLFDLYEDPSETTDLASGYPEQVKALENIFAEIAGTSRPGVE